MRLVLEFNVDELVPGTPGPDDEIILFGELTDKGKVEALERSLLYLRELVREDLKDIWNRLDRIEEMKR